MRVAVAVLIVFSALLIANPAEAQSRKRTQNFFQPTFPLLNWWQPKTVPVGPRVAASKGHSTSTACLPGRLKAALADVQRRFGPVTVVSTLRRGARIAGGRPSMHASCQAVDFRPARGTYSQAAAYLRRTWHGGMGTYSSGHIHIDTGDNYRWHQGGGSYARR
jgi:hypothetical protein